MFAVTAHKRGETATLPKAIVVSPTDPPSGSVHPAADTDTTRGIAE
jgi:hypothetical protein